MNLPPVLFLVLQTNAFADGGVSSISQVIARLRDHRPIIVTDRDGRRVDEWRSRGIETHVVPQTASRGASRNLLGTLRSYWVYRSEIGRLIKASGAKVVHANDPLALQLVLWPARSLGAAVTVNIRDTIDPDRQHPRLRYRFLFSLADHVFYLSHDMADRWARIASNAKRACSVTYSIVDPKRFKPADAVASEPPVVLLSGIIRRKKNQVEFLRRVGPSLAAEGIAIWIAGDFDPSLDPYMAECAEAAAQLGDAVRFLGYRSDIAEVMARSTVVAVPSRHEGLVRAMIEAMSCARPVVSFDICSARELLEQEGAGQVVALGEYDGMARAIIDYCRNPRLAYSAGKRGHATAARLFAAEDVVARYERVYTMLEGASAAPKSS